MSSVVAGRRPPATTDAAEAGPDNRAVSRPRWTQRLLGPLATVVLSTLAMAQALQVWNWRPGTPVELDGDGAYVLMQVKEILDHGWYWSNPDVGAPFGQVAGWFSDASWTHFVAIRLLGIVSSSPFTVSALYFFVCFPLAALSAYWLSRRIGVSRTGAVVVGVLFSVLPGHQHRFGHLWLQGYWVVPIAIWLVLLAVDRLPARSPDMTPRARLGLLAAVVVVGMGGVYYVAFTLILLGVVLGLSVVAGADRPTLVRGALLGIGLAVSCLVPITAAALQTRSETVTGVVPGQRGFWQSETYSGKIIDLVLPWIEHRVEGIAQLTRDYASVTTPSPEQPALGLVAGVGLVGLVVAGLALLLRRDRLSRTPLIGVLTVLTLVAVAFFTRGGLGALSAIVLTPSIRTWSRLVTFIALFGLLAAGLATTYIARRSPRPLVLALGAGLVVLGVLDQTNPALAPAYAETRARASTVTEYSTQLERSLGAGCAVFQLPVVPFPEQAPPARMTAYEQLQPYLTSAQLRWSYGAMRGTAAADWQLTLPALADSDALLDDLAAADFCAVELDGAGVEAPDEAARVLTELLGFPVATTPDGRLQAFDLRARRQQLVDAVGADSVARRGQMVLHRVPARP